MSPLRRSLRLTEHAETKGVALGRDEVDALRAAVKSLQVTPTPGREGHYDLKPQSEIGAIQVGDLAIEIRPKLGIENVLFLISYAVDPKSWRSTDFNFGTSPDLLEALIPGFRHQLSRALARGLLRGYRHIEESLTTVRGRIRMQEQVSRRFGSVLPVECEYSDYNEDVEENRLLRAALRRLERLRLRSPGLRLPLRAFELALGEVSEVEYAPRNLPTIRYSRLNQHYRPAVELAKLILRSASTELKLGGVRSSTFLVDMNQVFEDFVVVALREQLDLSQENFPQGARGKKLSLAEEGQIRLEPDISWWEGLRCVFVGDVKYKKLKPTAMPNADLYQLLSYSVATELQAGLLIYAAGEDEERSYRVMHLGRHLHVATLDLTGSPEDILAQVGDLAARVRALRAAASAHRAA